MAETMLKWIKYAINKNRDPFLNRVREYFYIWALETFVSSTERDPHDELVYRAGSWLSQKWNEKKKELIQANRYPMKKLSKNRREAEMVIFDHERKVFWKTRVARLLNSIFRNQRRRNRQLMMAAFTRFCFVVSMMKIKASTPYKVGKIEKSLGMKESFPLNLSRVPTERSFDHKMMSRRSIESSILEEKFDTLYGNEEWRITNRKEETSTPKIESKGINTLSVAAKDKRDKTPPAKSRVTKGVLQNNINTQNKENRSVTPPRRGSKSPTPANQYTSVSQDKRVRKLKALFKILFYLLKHRYNTRSKEFIYFYKWKLASTEAELKYVVDQLQELEIVMNGFVVKETSFRGKVKTLKREVDTKVAALEQYVATIDKK